MSLGSAPVTGIVTYDCLSKRRGIIEDESRSTGTFCPTVCPTPQDTLNMATHDTLSSILSPEMLH